MPDTMKISLGPYLSIHLPTNRAEIPARIVPPVTAPAICARDQLSSSDIGLRKTPKIYPVNGTLEKLARNNAKTIATGGLATVVETEVGLFDVVDLDLTLKGLHIVHGFNVNRD